MTQRRFVLRRTDQNPATASRAGPEQWTLGATLNPYLGEQGCFTAWPYARHQSFLLDFDFLERSCVQVELFVYSNHPEFVRDFGKVKTILYGCPKTFLEMEVRFSFDRAFSTTGERCLTTEQALDGLRWAGLAELSDRLCGERQHLTNLFGETALDDLYSGFVEDRDFEHIPNEALALLRLVEEYDSRVVSLAEECSRSVQLR